MPDESNVANDMSDAAAIQIIHTAETTQTPNSKFSDAGSVISNDNKDDAGWTSSVSTPTTSNRENMKTKGHLNASRSNIIAEETLSAATPLSLPADAEFTDQLLSNRSRDCAVAGKATRNIIKDVSTRNVTEEVEPTVESPTDHLSAVASLTQEKINQKDDVFDVSLSSAVAYYANAVRDLLHAAKGTAEHISLSYGKVTLSWKPRDGTPPPNR